MMACGEMDCGDYEWEVIKLHAIAVAEEHGPGFGGKGGGGRGGRGSRLRMDTCDDDNSFTGDTRVRMADGTSKPISEVKVGDQVLATDPVTNKTVVKTVVATIVGKGAKNLVEITVDMDGASGDTTGASVATDGHPFWLSELKTWLPAAELQAGQLIQTAAGTWVQITAVERWTETARVHNLTVDDIHTYYVVAGNTPVLVHNCGDIALGKQTVGDDDMALDIFAMERGAQTYKEWSGSGSWHQQLRGFIADGKTRIHVNLDGIDDPISYAASGRGVDPTDVGGRGFTRWEMYQLSQNPAAWNRVTWYRNGRAVVNPFGG